jgi:transposase InsO family protein
MPRLGTRKLSKLLKPDFIAAGIKLGRDALFDLLRQESLLITPKKTYTKTTNSKHWLRKYPNLYQNIAPKTIEKVFVSDITYIKTDQGVAYLSLVTDAYSRKIMGYHLSDTLYAEEVVQAMKQALLRRETCHSLIHHSDRGLQYCSKVYQDVLACAKVNASMTDGYDCYQNALAERINGIIKNEFLIYTCKTHKELKLYVKQSIDTYNNRRPHLSLNMQTPNQVHKKAAELSSCGIQT